MAAMRPPPMPSIEGFALPRAARSSLMFVAVALVAALLADLDITTRSPGFELQRMLAGALSPQLLPWAELLEALLQTLAYAIAAVTLAAGAGFGLSLLFQRRTVRLLCTALRSVHELFWGLLFIQLLGIQPLAGVLAIALPYTGIFAKVYAEILEEADAAERPALPAGSDRLSRFAYGTWARVRPHFASYTLYRLECGLRSSTVLGFIGLPTLGYHLVAAFMQGHYDQAAALLLTLYALIATLRLWMRWQLWPLLAALALGWVLSHSELQLRLLAPLLQDMVPAPLRAGDWGQLLPWLGRIVAEQALPGAFNTLLVTQMAVVLAGALALGLFPLLSRQFAARPLRWAGHWLLVLLRSTPELIITFVLLLLWGPSMLPAVIAMGVHNGAIVGHLSGRFSDALVLRIDASRGLNRYGFEVLPRIYGQFLAFLFYRWEVIMRETAVLGVLGIHTLGFYIDSAFERFSLDVALLLIVFTAALNIAIEAVARQLRQRLHLQQHADTEAPQPAL